MNAVHVPEKSTRESASQWAVWMSAGAVIALCAVVFLLWGLNGPVYLFDMIAAYCGF
jgi:hypothetical protein